MIQSTIFIWYMVTVMYNYSVSAAFPIMDRLIYDDYPINALIADVWYTTATLFITLTIITHNLCCCILIHLAIAS